MFGAAAPLRAAQPLCVWLPIFASVSGRAAGCPLQAGPCISVWNIDAGGHSCGSRIEWVMRVLKKTRTQAKHQIAKEFPAECGVCTQMDCEEQWGAQACTGNECYTCGARIEFVAQKLPLADAGDQVAKEFPNECGGCSKTQGCAEQWNNQACHGQFGHMECFTCGARIEYLRDHGKDDAAARQEIADTFFAQCGKCGGSGDVTIQSEGYALVWKDDFDGDAVDGTKWMHMEGGWGFGNNEEQFYTASIKNSFVSEGTLKIRALREEYNGRKFTSAKLQSRAPFWTYGKFSVRARILGTARGTWAAIWMMPDKNKYGRWPNSGEIDIMEHVGYDTGRVHATVHTGAYNHLLGTQAEGATSVDVSQWHTYTVEWRPDVMLFAVDDMVYNVFWKKSDDPMKWPFDHEFYFILNIAVGGNWGGAKGIDEHAFNGNGQIMEIDWARVEQRPIITIITM